MSVIKKIKTWQENNLLSAQQAEQILAFERARGNRKFWRTAFIFAGSLIGLGICLLVASNWDALGEVGRIAGIFTLLGAASGALFWSILRGRNGLKELFIVLAFLLVGACIGTVAQVFQSGGGWRSFAVMWAVLSLAYVWTSRVLFVNVCWWGLLLSGVFQWAWLKYFAKHFNITAVLLIGGLWLLSYGGEKLDKKFGTYTRLAAGFEKVALWSAYAAAWFVGVRWGMLRWDNSFAIQCWANLTVLFFLGARLDWAICTQNQTSFKRNALLTEMYIFGIFASQFGNLFLSGLGFIFGGVLVLMALYVFRKTARYIASMEAFR